MLVDQLLRREALGRSPQRIIIPIGDDRGSMSLLSELVIASVAFVSFVLMIMLLWSTKTSDTNTGKGN